MNAPVHTFSITRFDDIWSVVSAAGTWGRFAYRIDAEEAAVRAAGALTARGEVARVLVQGPGAVMRPLSDAVHALA